MLRLQTARSAVNKVVPSTTYTVRTMTAFSQMSDNDPKVLEKEKQKHLQKEKEKKWNEKLASQSEAAVKADKSEDKPLKTLQEDSIKELKDQESDK
ncbi:hypothetical protein VKS41_008651 [Umbelopsis sp. WA50703]